MAIFDRFNIKIVASAGMLGAAIALSPDAAAMPLKTGGACIYPQAGEAAALPAAGGPVGAGAAGAGACGAPLTDMAGVPLAAPGAIPVPGGAPIIALAPPPLFPPVPLGAPVGAPLPLGAPLVALGGAPADIIPAAPLLDMAGVNDQPTGPAPAGGPAVGQPTFPGPAPSPFAH